MAAGAQGAGLAGLPLAEARGGAGLAVRTRPHGRRAGARRAREGEGNLGAVGRVGGDERGAGGRLLRTRPLELGNVRREHVSSASLPWGLGGWDLFVCAPTHRYFCLHCRNTRVQK